MSAQPNPQKITITGGAGFIGSNLAHRLLGRGHQITVFDNLSRSGGEQNLQWLRAEHGDTALRLVKGELADFDAVQRACAGAQRIYHLAGQVAVTTSVTDPRHDFESNALGTFNVLEAARLVGDAVAHTLVGGARSASAALKAFIGRRGPGSTDASDGHAA